MKICGNRLPLTLCGLLLLTVGGCGGKVNQENFNRIQTGMNESEVVAILGEPSVRQEVGGPLAIGGKSASAKQLMWQSGDRSIVVQMMDGKVITKSSSGL